MKDNQKIMPLNIQLFADEDGTDLTPTEKGAVETPKEDGKKEDKTYSRDEVNKMISAEREKIKAEIKKQAEAEKTEAEKLAKMNADEIHRYELEKERKEKNEALAKVNAYELKEQATKIATEKEMDISLLSMIDYSKETADSVKTKLDNIDKIFKNAVEKRVNERLQQKSPKQYSAPITSSDKEYLKTKYKDNPYFKQK